MTCSECEYNQTCFRDKSIVCPNPLPEPTAQKIRRLLLADPQFRPVASNSKIKMHDERTE